MPVVPASGRWWRDPRGWPLAVCGFVLLVSGLVHLAVWGVHGGAWEGPVTWRKPILFGISGGLTAWSLGWVWSALHCRRGDVPLAHLTAWALFVEVGLIDLQAWRGVASHFNRATPFDSSVYDAMGVLILGVTLVVIDLAVRLVRQPSSLAADMRAAARAGMVFLAISCGLGIWSSVHGDLQASRGRPPEIVAAAGVAKFPHGAVLHAIQWLPALVWLARRAGIDAARRVWCVRSAIAGTGLLLAYALAQTSSGRSRFDVTPSTAALLVVGSCLLAGPWLVALATPRGAAERPRRPSGGAS